MSYLQDRNKKRNKIRNVIVVVVVFLLLFYFQTGVFQFLSVALNKFGKPLITIGNNIGSNLKNTEIFFTSKKSLEEENNNLKQELLELNTSASVSSILEDENVKLKEILGRKSSNANFTLASILSKPNKSIYDTILIDAGANQGVEMNDLVFALGDIPIGRVSEGFSDSAKVTIFSTSGEKTDIMVTGHDTIMQIVGRGGGNFEMILPRDFELAEGSKVTLLGINPYLMATVVTIISDPRDSYKKALLASPVNIQELKFVEVGI
ncbi:MAG: rod shape-determining protein MreC [bacterium]|nr:rod shape-determining protein MreC [bacterium]